MLTWEGENVVFLTKKGDYSREELTAFVKRLDDGWSTYSELVGQQARGISLKAKRNSHGV